MAIMMGNATAEIIINARSNKILVVKTSHTRFYWAHEREFTILFILDDLFVNKPNTIKYTIYSISKQHHPIANALR